MRQEILMTQVIRSAAQLGTVIRNERLLRNLTQQQLADFTGTGQKTISQIETGHAGARLDTIFRLLAVLGLEIAFSPRDVGADGNLGDVF